MQQAKDRERKKIEEMQQKYGELEICVNNDHFYAQDSICGVVHLKPKQDI